MDLVKPDEAPGLRLCRAGLGALAGIDEQHAARGVEAAVILNRPLGKLIVSAPGWALAAMIADRSETCPCASLPVWRFTATVSSRVLTAKVVGTCRTSSDSSPGCHRVFRKSRPDRAFAVDLLVPPAFTFFIADSLIAIGVVSIVVKVKAFFARRR
jgi:hypothetical protein